LRTQNITKERIEISTQNYLTPPEITEATIQTGIKKSKMTIANMVILGILAGAFIAFAAEGSSMASFNFLARAETYGLGKVLAGAVFGTGLMLVLIAGGELFTGNTMMIAGVLDKKVSIKSMLKNWLFVYIGNFIGSIFIVYMMNQSGLFSSGDNMLGAVTIKIAVYKVGLTFSQAFFLGIMCNWLVCLGVWMAYGAKDMVGKIFAIFFHIRL
jgi:formate/nitrite transporter